MSRQQDQNLMSLINSGGLFFIEGTRVHVIPLYRGDGRAPEVILPEGFACRGANPDLMAHVHDGARTSIYIPTSRSKQVAMTFAEKNCRNNKSFVYEINPQKAGLDVLKTLKPDIQSGKANAYVCEHALLEKEVAVPHKIAAYDIKGVWVLEENVSTGNVTKTFVKNPRYLAPLSRTSTALRAAGKVMTGVAAVADTVDLCYAFFESTEAGNYERFFNEGARIAGGWSAAIAAGAVFGQMGALWLAPFGPVASLVGGLTFGAAGSIAAYYAGGALAQEVETRISRVLREERFVLNNFQKAIEHRAAMHYVEAVFNGNIITDEDLLTITKARLHPDQHAIIPMTELMKDAVLLAIGEPTGNIVLESEYRHALERMKIRTDIFTCSIAKFEENVKNEASSKTTPRIFVPGEFLIAAKDCASQQTTRTLFRTARIDYLPPKLQFFNLADIRADKLVENNYIYVIDKNMKLHIGYGQERLNGQFKIYHSQIAHNESVYAAGQFHTSCGKITQIDNNSGHYKPNGNHLNNLVESVFLKHGFYEAPGLFENFEFGIPGFAYQKKGPSEPARVKVVETAAITKAQKELAAAKQALAERRELELKIQAKKAALARLTLESEQAAQKAAEAAAVFEKEKALLTAAQHAEKIAHNNFLQLAKLAGESARAADAARIKADNSLRVSGLLTANGLLKTQLLPTQLTASSSFSDAFVAIRNLKNNAELKKNENFLAYSKQMDAFQDYLFNKVGRRLPILPQILEAHPTVSTADEFYALAQNYINGDKAKNHYALDCLHIVVALNPNHHNALCLIGAVYFSRALGTQENQTIGVDYLKRAREKGNATATAILSAIPAYVSTTPDNDGEGQRAAAAGPGIADRIRNAINSGRFDLRDHHFHDARGSGQGNDDYDHRGEHAGDWGARGGSDMWGGGSTSGNGAQWDFVGTEARPSGEGTWDHYRSSRDGSSMYTNLR